MAPNQLIRVIALRKGKLKPTEFMLRPGEKGLSLFARTDEPDVETILSAVREAGKQGELAAVSFDAKLLHGFGLRLVSTPGRTPLPAVNTVHWETRFSFWRSMWFFLRRSSVYNYFNEKVAPELAKTARIID